MKRFLYRLSLLLGILSVILGGLLFSVTGNRWLWDVARSALPALQGNIIRGHLGSNSGITLQNIGWKKEGFCFYANKLTVRWEWKELFLGSLSFTNIELSKPVITVDSQQSKLDEQIYKKESAESFRLFLPFDLNIQSLLIDTLSVRSPDISLVTGRMSLALILDKKEGLMIDQARISHPVIHVLTSELSGTKETFSLPPEMNLPLALDIKTLMFKDMEINYFGGSQAVSSAVFQVKASGSQVQLFRSDVIGEQGSLSIAGHIDLHNDYPLNINSRFLPNETFLNGQLKEEILNLKVRGSLKKLIWSMQASGPADVQLSGWVFPLEENTPFYLKAHWRDIRWPMQGEESVIDSKEGRLTVSGKLDHYQVDLSLQADMSNRAALTTELRATGGQNYLTVNHWHTCVNEGTIDNPGTLSWEKGVSWAGQLVLQGINPVVINQQLQGSINGTLDYELKWVASGWQFALPRIHLDGQYGQSPFSVHGDLQGNSRQNWMTKSLQLSVGNNQLVAQGGLINQQWQASVLLEGKQLAQVYPELEGALNGSLRVSGHKNNPALTFFLDSPQVSYDQTSATGFHAQGKWGLGSAASGNMTAGVQSVTQNHWQWKKIALGLSGALHDHRLSLNIDKGPVAGVIKVQGGWKDHCWQGTVHEVVLNTLIGQWQLDQTVGMVLGNRQLSLSEQQWSSGKTRFIVDRAELTAQSGHAGFILSGFDTATLPAVLLPEGMGWQTQVSAKGQLNWQEGELPLLQLTAETSEGVLQVADIRKNYQTLGIELNINQHQATGKIRFQSDALGSASSQIAIEDIRGGRRIQGQWNIDHFLLSTVQPFIPEVESLNGQLSSHGTVAGSVDKPLLYGSVIIAMKELSTETDVLSLSDAVLNMDLKGFQGKLSGYMRAGGEKSSINVQGYLNWLSMPIKGMLSLRGQSVKVAWPSFGEARVNPDLNLEFGSELRLRGEILVPWARIRIKSLPKKAVKLSDDVVMVDPEKKEHSDKRIGESDDDLFPLRMNVKIVLGHDVSIHAYGLKTRLEDGVDLVVNSDELLQVRGTVRLVEGSYNSFGQDLQITEGKIFFSGSATNPFLSVEAIRNPDNTEDDVTVGIRVSSSVNNPDWVLFSDPSLPQDEQLSYLFRGRGLKDDSSDSNALQAMLVGMGIGRIGDSFSEVGEVLGIHDLVLDTEGSGSDTRVTLSGYVAPKIFVQYGVGVFNSLDELRIRYELLPCLFLQAVSGLNQTLDVLYRFTL
ncbi:Translocation and assembly module TamB [invertebrate metagenome]|uniref:Translocation and assembly module TamB n=1 Tax=invertebrate metagenome TaxID=1711999 RepID=A0A2H9TCD1_9ZZZZ